MVTLRRPNHQVPHAPVVLDLAQTVKVVKIFIEKVVFIVPDVIKGWNTTFSIQLQTSFLLDSLLNFSKNFSKNNYDSHNDHMVLAVFS